MQNFFNVQYDYVYFFYGLAFFLLSILCFSLRHDREQLLPWFWLGLFGLVHGLNEWMEILEINHDLSFTFSAAHLAVLFFSYICFWEFARIGFRLQGKKLGSLWVYAFILPLAFSGIQGGLLGLNITFRYFVGFPAGVLSAWIIFSASQANPSKRNSLRVLSIGLFVYAILSGLIVPKADYLWASWLNDEFFYQQIGVPVQLVRGMLALVSAMALWFYPYTPQRNELLSKKPFVYLKPSKWIILITLIIFIGAGWVFTNYLDYYAGIQLIKKSRESEYSPFNRLIKELAQLEKIGKVISHSRPVKTALLTRQDKDLTRAVLMIQDYMGKFSSVEFFMLDVGGKTVLSIGGNALGTATDQSFVSASYFKQAMNGKTGYYFTLGAIYAQRVYYVSFPIKDEKDKILGVVVLKKNISASPIIQYRLLSIFFTMFVCILTVVFFIALKRRETMIALVNEMNEKLNSVDKMKNDFVAIVSHELRTPLTSVKNAATILLKDGASGKMDTDDRKEFLEMILNNTDRLARIVSDLLDISKIEAGVLTVYKVPTNLFVLAREVMAALQSYADEKKISLRISAEKELVVILIDPEKTRRVFTNLIHNAIKFTPENGEVTVIIEDKGWEVQASVTDTGFGMSREDSQQIFNKFYRSSDVRVRHEGGSGLGLAITKGLIEAQGGKIWVESELNKGSSFYFSFSVEQEKRDPVPV
ncbi:MAG: sensor histidine kinase [Candidatus Omnitrophica bacterium]|nr:sensor histidine kinase [Candidatus Omnitrophota bacterium]